MSISRRLRGTALRAAVKLDSGAITDERLARTLGAYAGLVEAVLDQPERWLAVEGPSALRGAPTTAVRFVRRAVSGDVHPGSPDWSQQPREGRVGWWLRRIAITAGTAAAAPRLAGLLADRLPVQAALSASASGLAVCAVARENGVEDPDAWVPLLARVVFDRELGPVADSVPAGSASQETLASAEADAAQPPHGMQRLGEGGQRAVRGMWRLARTLMELQDVFDERPRGGLLVRGLAKLPVVGVVGGWLDERGAVAAAAAEAQELLDARTS